MIGKVQKSNLAVGLKENPIHSVKCYSKDGSPSKPNSLLEQEISMLQHIQGAKHQKSAPPRPGLVGGEEEGEGEGEGSENYRSDSRVNRESAAHLDEGFIRSFLSGELCLRGGSGWWQHEVCYGKHVKQVHEEAGKAPEVLYLGYWMREGHIRWFPNAGPKKQSKSHVIHLYMNGDSCDVTGVPRQCKVKFRCSESSRASQISLFLEEPTTCNYVLTVEAAFLCPLLKNTDNHGLLSLTSGEGLAGKAQYEEEVEYDDNGNVKSRNLDPESEASEWDPEQSDDTDDKKKSSVNQR